ncbi:MAG: hypothetical protein Q9174_005471 [Haloplaca sp. 1 TL-2023]
MRFNTVASTLKTERKRSDEVYELRCKSKVTQHTSASPASPNPVKTRNNIIACTSLIPSTPSLKLAPDNLIKNILIQIPQGEEARHIFRRVFPTEQFLEGVFDQQVLHDTRFLQSLLQHAGYFPRNFAPDTVGLEHLYELGNVCLIDHTAALVFALGGDEDEVMAGWGIFFLLDVVMDTVPDME